MNIDKHSQSWQVVQEWAEKELDKKRQSLEYPRVEDKIADQCRGSIDTLKSLMKLTDQPPSQ